ncbi:unnamed protein product [Umbelopsis sp. WA50703]
MSNAGDFPPAQPTNVLRFVDDYWAIISNYVREPGFFSFSSTTSKLAIRDTAFMQKLLSTVISEDNASPVKGDLMPSVVVKSCCELYERLDQDEKIKFFEILSRDFGVDRKLSAAASSSYLKLVSSEATSDSQLWKAENILKNTLEPSHSKFFDKVNQLPGGMKFLVDMRADLLEIIGAYKHRQDSIGHLISLDASIKYKLQNWLFGFLKLERITWQSPAVLLEKIGKYEAVHAVRDWQDMKSPIPGFRGWLRNQVEVNEEIRRELEGVDYFDSAHEILDTTDWIRDRKKADAIKPALMRLCARYLVSERRGIVAMDPVANFHLRNGACAHQLNWMADTSDKGIAESFSIMVNYNYLLDHIEENNEQYLASGIITISEGESENAKTQTWLRNRIGQNVRAIP